MKASRIFKRGGNDGELIEVLLEVGDKDGAAVVGAEIVVSGQHRADDASQLLVVLAFVVHEDAGDVLGVVEIAHGAEGNHHKAVVVVVAALDLALVDAHHFKAQAVDADILSQGRFAGEQPAPGFVADHYATRARCSLVLFAESSSRGDRETTDALVHRIDAGEKKIGKSASVVLNGDVSLVEDGSDALDHGHFVADVVDVGESGGGLRCRPWRLRPAARFGPGRLRSRRCPTN